MHVQLISLCVLQSIVAVEDDILLPGKSSSLLIFIQLLSHCVWEGYRSVGLDCRPILLVGFWNNYSDRLFKMFRMVVEVQ